MICKATLFLCAVSVAGVMLTGCASTSTGNAASTGDTTKKAAKVAAKVAVKSAIRHSPVAVVKAIK